MYAGKRFFYALWFNISSKYKLIEPRCKCCCYSVDITSQSCDYLHHADWLPKPKSYQYLECKYTSKQGALFQCGQSSVKHWLHNHALLLNRVICIACYMYCLFRQHEYEQLWVEFVNLFKFLLTSYVGLILRSTAVATTSHSAVEGTMRLLYYCMQSSFAAFPHSSIRVPS